MIITVTTYKIIEIHLNKMIKVSLVMIQVYLLNLQDIEFFFGYLVDRFN
jgi:hypothetical protein